MFQATGTNDRPGSIGLDDIVMTDGCKYSGEPLPGYTTLAPTTPGPTTPLVCNPSWLFCAEDQDTCVTPEQMCDFYPNCPTGSDDEEMCGKLTFDLTFPPLDNLCVLSKTLHARSEHSQFYLHRPFTRNRNL